MARGSDNTNTKDTSAIEAAARRAAEIAAKIAAEIAAAIAAQKAAERAAALEAKKAEQAAAKKTEEAATGTKDKSNNSKDTPKDNKDVPKDKAVDSSAENAGNAEAKVAGVDQIASKHQLKTEPKTIDLSPAIYPDSVNKKDSAEGSKNTDKPVAAKTNERPSDDLLKATATQLRKDLNVDKGPLDPRGGDSNAVNRTISSLPRTNETMERLKTAYKNDSEHPGSNLTADIESRLPKDKSDVLKAVIDRPESKLSLITVAAKHLKEADENSKKFDPVSLAAGTLNPLLGGAIQHNNATESEKSLDNARGELRKQLYSMNSDQLKEADAESQKRNGVPLSDLLKTQGLRSEDKQAIKILLDGSDGRLKDPELGVKLAQIGVKAKDLSMVGEGLQESAQARELFKARGYDSQLATAFQGNDLKSAQDLVKTGRTDISTHVEFNQGMFGTDEKGVREAIKNMTAEQRETLQRGRELSNSTTSPANQSTQDSDAVANYKKLDQTLGYSFNSRVASDLKAQALHGDNIISKSAQTHWDGFFGIGSGHDSKKVFDTVDKQLTANDYKQLQTSKDFRDDLTKSLKTYLPKEEIERVNEIIDRKLEAGSFEKSKNVGRTTVEKLQDLGKGVSPSDQGKAINNVLNMTESERNSYKNVPAERVRLDTQLNETLGQNSESTKIAQRLLSQTIDGKQPSLTPLDKVTVGGLNGDNLPKTIDNIENYIKSDPTALARLKNPITPEDKNTKQKLEKELTLSVTRSGEVYSDENGSNFDSVYNPLAKKLFENGRVDIGEKLSHTGRDLDAYKSLANVSPQEREILLKKPETAQQSDLHRDVFSRFGTAAEQQLAKEIIQNGDTTLTQFRAAALTKQTFNSDERSQLKGNLDKVKVEDRTALNSAYADKFKEPLSNLIDKVPQSEKAAFESLLRGGSQSTAEQITKLQLEQKQSESGLLGKVGNASEYMANQSTADFVKNAAGASAKFENLAPAEQQKYFDKAMESIRLRNEKKNETADTITNTGIVVGALGVTVASGGAASPLLIGAVGLGGSAAKVGGNMLLLGKEGYLSDTQRVLADGASGFANAATAFIGPQQLTAAFKIGDSAASATAKEFAKVLTDSTIVAPKYFMKEGGEETVKNGLQSLYRESIASGSNQISEQAVKKLASEVATNGSGSVLIEESLIKAIKTSKPSDAAALLTGAGLNSVAGGVAGSSSELVSATGAWDKNRSVEENLATIGSRAKDGAIGGAVTGAVFTVGFKVLGSAVSKLSETTYPSNQYKATGERVADLSFTPNSTDGSLNVSGLSKNDLYMISLKKGQAPEILNHDGKVVLSGDEKLVVLNRDAVKREYQNLSPAELKQKFANEGITDFQSYSAKALVNDSRPFVEIPLEGKNTKVLVPVEDIAAVKNAESKTKLVADKSGDTGESHPASASQSPSATVDGGATPLKTVQGHLFEPVTPTAISRDLHDLPNGGDNIKKVILENRQSSQDPWSTVEHFDKQGGTPFYSSQSANHSASELTIYPNRGYNNIAASRQEGVRHEWSHFEEASSKYRSVYDSAVQFETLNGRQPQLLRNYAGYNTHESWAVHLGEGHMGDSDQAFRKLVLDAKGTPSQIKELIHAKTLEESLQNGLNNGHDAPRFFELMQRSQWAQHELAPSSKAQLDVILRYPTASSPVERHIALELYPKLFGSEAGDALLTMKPNGAKETSEILKAAKEAYGGKIPESYLETQAKGTGTFSTPAALELYSQNPTKGFEPAMAKLNDGQMSKLYEKSGDLQDGRNISKLITSAGTIEQQGEAMVKVLSGFESTASRDSFFNVLYNSEMDSKLTLKMIEWASSQAEKTKELNHTVRLMANCYEPIYSAAWKYVDTYGK